MISCVKKSWFGRRSHDGSTIEAVNLLYLLEVPKSVEIAVRITGKIDQVADATRLPAPRPSGNRMIRGTRIVLLYTKNPWLLSPCSPNPSP